MGKDNIIDLMVNFMTAIGLTIKWKEMAKQHGENIRAIQVVTKIIKNMALEHFNEQETKKF